MRWLTRCLPSVVTLLAQTPDPFWCHQCSNKSSEHFHPSDSLSPSYLWGPHFPLHGRTHWRNTKGPRRELYVCLQKAQPSIKLAKWKICKIRQEKALGWQQCCGTVTIFYGSGSGSDFWKVTVPVPVRTFEKLWFRFPFLLLKKLRFRFRFRFQLHI